MNYRDWLPVEPENRQGTRTTKCATKPYGYMIHRFNNYITVYRIKLVINKNGSAKATVDKDRNYCPHEHYTEYFDANGEECSKSEYWALNK